MLPTRASENAAFLTALSRNVSSGLTIGSCADMVAHDSAGPDDLYDRPTRVVCGPPRLCGDGEDGKRGTADDACTPLDPKLAGPDDMTGLMRKSSSHGTSTRVERRFLVVDAQARPGCDMPDAAIVHFYASLMRGDDTFEAVLPPAAARSKTLTYKLEKTARFRIHGMRIDELACTERECTFRVWIDVSRKDATPSDKHQRGADSGQLERIDGKWTMTRPPS